MNMSEHTKQQENDMATATTAAATAAPNDVKIWHGRHVLHFISFCVYYSELQVLTFSRFDYSSTVYTIVGWVYLAKAWIVDNKHTKTTIHEKQQLKNKNKNQEPSEVATKEKKQKQPTR